MKYLLSGALVVTFVFGVSMASADNLWGGYHFARTANPFTLTLRDSVSSSWDSYLQTTANDWSLSTVLDMVIVPGTTKPRNCQPTSGQVAVCSEKYGNNGWLGIAQVWISGIHITQGIVKLNDSYYTKPAYNTPAWRNLVMCQEVGHTLGLDHQDENFDNPNLGTCMDYTNNPASNQHPNDHDYLMLEELYGHADSTTTIKAASARGKGSVDALTNGNSFGSPEWGTLMRQSPHGGQSVFVKELLDGQKVFTFVTWAQ